MADEKLSGKVGLDTTAFKTGIAGMNRELRVLESGFRASAAGLGDWANDATGLEMRIKSLNGQMDIQQKKVAATRAEYERIKTEKGENSRAAQDLEIKLNKETETLNKMERELQQATNGLEEMKSDSDRAAKSVDHLGDEEAETTARTLTLRAALATLGAGLATVVIGIRNAAKALVAMTVAVAALVVGLVAFTVGPASDLNETISKTQVVFGSAADKVLAFGETSAKALGLSKNAALSAAGTYGNLLRAMGLTEEASAEMSIELVELAADLASFNNLAPEEVLEKLRAGLTGEAEPLKQLGVNMNQARIEAKALELGLIKQGEELTAAAKAQAAYAIIMEDTSLAQGDFARTSQGLANQQRIMAANFVDLRAKMGNAFLPIVNLLAQKLNELFGSDEFNEFFKGLIGWFEETAKKIEPFVNRVALIIQQLLGGASLFTVFEDGSTILGGFFELFGLGEDAANNLALQIINIKNAISDFVTNTLIPFTKQHWPEIKAALIGIGAALAAAGVVAAIAAIVAAINPVTLIIAAIAAAVGLLAAAWEGNWGGMRDTLTAFWQGSLQPTLQTLWEWLSTNIPAALQTLSGVWTGILLPAIRTVWGFLSGSLFPLFQAVGEFIGAVFNLYLRVLAGLWQNVLLPALQGVYQFLDANVFPIFRTIGDYISGNLQPILDGLASFINSSLTPAFEGITEAIETAVDWIVSLADSINNLELPDWLTPGSPTPWEIGLIGINNAMRDLNQEMPVLAQNLQLQPSGVPGLGASGGAGSVQNDSFAFYAPVILQGATPAGSLGARLKGRRY